MNIHTDNVAPVFGIEKGAFNIGDLPNKNPHIDTAINSVAVNTKSAVISGSPRYEIYVTFSNPAATCDLIVYRKEAQGAEVEIKRYTGVNRFSNGLYVGGQDLAEVNECPLIFEVKNISAGQVTVNVAGH